MSHERSVTTKKNLLTVGVDVATFEEVAPPLLRTIFEVDRISSPQAGLELVSQIPFAAIVIRHPLEGMAIEDFLAAVRAQTSASRDARIALLTTSTAEEQAAQALNTGVFLIVSLEDHPGQREERLCTMLRIQPRSDARVLVKLEVKLSVVSTDRFVAQTKDLSASGMFVITRKLHPVGSRALFEFSLIGERRPVRGVAEITRLAGFEQGSHHGMGMRFLSFEEGSRSSLHAYLDRQAL